MKAPGGPYSCGEALWWTAMIMTTMGSQYWPQTIEGRMLCVFLALYALREDIHAMSLRPEYHGPPLPRSPGVLAKTETDDDPVSD